ncbi:MAG TPA: HAD-IA family hydrolase [Candidatus Limnocylindria bacterium]|nr:HAD-IA family hydrolase [Candidatus Limnocylindria bacterium]
MRHRLVCFDAGFTLIRPRQTMAERLALVLASHGHAAGEEDLRRAWEAADEWFWEEYHRPGNVTWTDDGLIEETWRSYHQLMFRELGISDGDRRLLDAVLASQFAVDAWEPYPDALPALETLRPGQAAEAGAAGAPRPAIGVVSDWSSNLADVLAAAGLAPYVDFVLASGAIGLAKPAPELFALACRRAGVEPAQAVMVGDSYRADVLGARSAGMDGVLLDRAGEAADVEPGVPVIRSLEGLPAILGAVGAPTHLAHGSSAPPPRPAR